MAKVIHNAGPGSARLNAALKGLGGKIGKVGWFSTSLYSNGTPVAYVAAIQEVGYGKIPPRLGMRATAAEKKQEWTGVAEQGAKAVLAGSMTGEQAMEVLGQTAAGDIRKHISTVVAPPLSPITVMLRGMKHNDTSLVVTGATVGEAAQRVADGKTNYGASTKPLVDSGILLGTLTNTTESKGA